MVGNGETGGPGDIECFADSWMVVQCQYIQFLTNEGPLHLGIWYVVRNLFNC